MFKKKLEGLIFIRKSPLCELENRLNLCYVTDASLRIVEYLDSSIKCRHMVSSVCYIGPRDKEKLNLSSVFRM